MNSPASATEASEAPLNPPASTDAQTMSRTQELGNTNPRVEYLQWLAESGKSDVLTLRRETAEQVLTQKRVELIEHLVTEEEVSSVRELARHLDRDVSIVSRDLDVLFEAGVVEYEENGRAKEPVLAHETVLVEPVLFDGAVLEN